MQPRESSATLCIYAYPPLPLLNCITAKIHHHRHFTSPSQPVRQSSTAATLACHHSYTFPPPIFRDQVTYLARVHRRFCASPLPFLCLSVAIFQSVGPQFCANPTSILLESIANFAQIHYHSHASWSPFWHKFVAIFVQGNHQFSDRREKTNSSEKK